MGSKSKIESRKGNYWVTVWTGTTWQEFLDSGAETCGLADRYLPIALGTKIGDYILCYVAGISRFIGILEILSAPFRDTSHIFSFGIYPVRIKVRLVVSLTPETAIPISELKDRLSVFSTLKNSAKWAMLFRTSFRHWPITDGEVVTAAIEGAAAKPVHRPFRVTKLRREPQ